MQGGLAPGDLQYFRLAFAGNQPIHHPANLAQAQVLGMVAGIGEANRTAQITSAGDFDDAQTSVLLMLRAKPARLGTAFELSLKPKRDGPWLVEPSLVMIGAGVGRYQGFKPTMLRTPFAHKKFFALDH